MTDSGRVPSQVAVGDTCHWCDGAKVYGDQRCARCEGTGKILAIQGWWSQVAGYRETGRG